MRCFVAGLAGWGDELIQYFLPNRVYDLRDVAFNAEAAALVVAFLAARRLARRRDARRGHAEVATPASALRATADVRRRQADPAAGAARRARAAYNRRRTWGEREGRVAPG